MTENKNQELIVWILGRVRTLTVEMTAQSMQRIQELIQLTKATLPKEEAEALVNSIRNLAKGQPVSEEHQNMQKTALTRLQAELKDWKIAIKSETEPGPMLIGRNAVLPGKTQWHVLATKNSEEFHTAGTHSLQMELASQNHSLNTAIEQVLEKHKELKAIGLE